MKRINKSLFLGLLLMISTSVFADGGNPPPPGPPNPPVPIAGAVLGLFIAGAAYGIKKVKDL